MTDILPSNFQSYGQISSAEACGSRILKSVYDSISTVANNSTENILLTPASHQLALKLLELAMQLGLQVSGLYFEILINSFTHSRIHLSICLFVFSFMYSFAPIHLFVQSVCQSICQLSIQLKSYFLYFIEEWNFRKVYFGIIAGRW